MTVKKQLLNLFVKSIKPLLWAIVAVFVVVEVQRLFYQLKIDWYAAIAAVLGIATPILWDWIKSQIAVAKAATEENKKAIASQFDLLNGRINGLVNQIERLTIQQQVDEQVREEVVDLKIEVERLKGDINLGERLRFVEQVIYKFTANAKDTNC